MDFVPKTRALRKDVDLIGRHYIRDMEACRDVSSRGLPSVSKNPVIHLLRYTSGFLLASLVIWRTDENRGSCVRPSVMQKLELADTAWG